MPFKPRYSDARKAASRANGAKSRGPLTAEGKARSSRNNTRHGLLSRDPAGLLSKDMVLPTEDATAFDAINANLTAEFNPTSEIERAFAKSFAMAYLRLNRAWDVQAAALLNEVARHPELTGAHGTLKAMNTLCQPGQTFPLYRRYEVTHERSMYRAWNHFKNLRSAADGPLPFEPEDRITSCPSTASPQPDPAGQAAANETMNLQTPTPDNSLQDRSSPEPEVLNG